ncbi:MAG: gliding motility-associated C-terminal domain-containing protein [Bacteroidia bacterium]|nr:gliding motility-associated C-terminal domain-containing protein [Bacteroidia bacterium]
MSDNLKLILYFLLPLLLLSSGNSCIAQLAAEAGNSVSACPNQTYTIGGSPTALGGSPPYSYLWTPSQGLSNPNSANPLLTPTTAVWMYYVQVTDAVGNTAIDSMNVWHQGAMFSGAGNDTGVCFGETVVLGEPGNSSSGLTFAWLPAVGLPNPSAPNPQCTINTTTTYTVTISGGICPVMTETVTVTIYALPAVSAGPDVTINEGDVTTLSASGASQYWWTPNNTLLYATTANPDAFPLTTTTYLVVGTSAEGCFGYDQVTVFVNPYDSLIFYNTFTPNNDGDNDFFYIGNVFKYPDNKLTIYNRYGNIVYMTTPYLNLWDGENFGEDVPDGTYYYIFDDGKGRKYFGSVTIIR